VCLWRSLRVFPRVLRGRSAIATNCEATHERPNEYDRGGQDACRASAGIRRRTAYAITARVSAWSMRNRCFGRFSGCTANRIFRGRGSGWRQCTGSSTGTAGEFGRRARSIEGRRFSLRCRRRRQPRVDWCGSRAMRRLRGCVLPRRRRRAVRGLCARASARRRVFATPSRPRGAPTSDRRPARNIPT